MKVIEYHMQVIKTKKPIYKAPGLLDEGDWIAYTSKKQRNPFINHLAY